MPLLSCTARTCLYNKNEYCSKGDIQVDGPNAQRPDETCCKSFVEKKEGAMNSMETGTATQTIQVACKACECTYNDQEKCDADDQEKCDAAKITIAGTNACRCDETMCGSFYKK